MTPGKLTTEITFMVKVTLVSDVRTIPEEVAKTVTKALVQDTLTKAIEKATYEGDNFDIEVVPRAHFIYDLRGLNVDSWPSKRPSEWTDAERAHVKSIVKGGSQ